MAGLISSLFIKLTADTTKFETGMNRAGRKLTATQKKFVAAQKAVRGFGAALGVSVSVGTFMRFSKSAIEMGSRLDDVSKKLGVSADLLQEFGFAARQTGIRTEAAEMGLQRFTRRLAEAQNGSGEMLPVLKQYNIALTDSDGAMRNVEAVLRDYADALKGARTPQEQLRMAFKAFDSEGAGLVTVLRNGAAGLDDWAEAAKTAGQVMSTDTIRYLAEAENLIEQMNMRLTIWTGNILKMTSIISNLSAAMPNLPGASVFAPFVGIGQGADGTPPPIDTEGIAGETAAVKDSALAWNDRYLTLKKLTGTESEYRKHLKDRVAIFNRLAAEEFKLNGLTEKYIGLLEDAAKTQQEMMSVQTEMSSAVEMFAGALEDGLINASREGKIAFKDMAQFILAEIQRIALRILVLRPIFNSIGGMFGGTSTAIGSAFMGAFGGGKASGGPVSAGGTYLVGERGPELVTMGANGYVTPNHMMGGGSVYYVDARSADQTGLTALAQAIRETNGSIEQRAVAAVSNTYRRNPGFLRG